MSRGYHFNCTRCGKCCHGLLPLTCKDAFAHADLFPLCFLWTPVRADSKEFAHAAKLGTTIAVAARSTLAVLIMPTAYLPASFPCPALRDGTLCSIHDHKPSRCKSMPFYPYRDERHQAEMIKPRAGWACDVSTTAPLVYQDHTILDRAAFDQEHQELLDQVPQLRRYSEYMMQRSPALAGALLQAVNRTQPGHVVTSLSSFFTATRYPLAASVAALQQPLLARYAAQTANDAALLEFHRNYDNWAQEMAYLAKG